MLLVRDILSWLDFFAPFRYAASWDQCGLQVGDPDASVTRILVALDPNTATLNEAEEHECQCLVAHHPLWLHPLKTVRADQFPGNLIIRAVRKGIHVIAAHTNLDVAKGGTNDHLSQMLSVHTLQPLEGEDSRVEEDRYSGMGLIGFLPEAISFRALVEKTIKAFGGITVRAVGSGEKQVYRVALCTGSGGSLMEQAISAGSDVFITGDVKYHEAQRALEAGLALIDIGHFASERIIVQPLAAFLRTQAAGRREALEVLEARVERDPFWYPPRDANY
jgi:dinuclear metal center YbgI/SA1388 family protein